MGVGRLDREEERGEKEGRRTRSLPWTYWTMNSFASFAAFTRVSVPCTGRAKESTTTRALPTTLPCMMPMISYGTPERAWMAWFKVSGGALWRTKTPCVPS